MLNHQCFSNPLSHKIRKIPWKDFAEISKNLARYRSENDFLDVGPSK